MKHKVGDIVRIKSIDWYNSNRNKYIADSNCAFISISGMSFASIMSPYCGKEAKIINICYNKYYELDIDDGAFGWVDWMFEDEPSKKIWGIYPELFPITEKTVKMINKQLLKCINRMETKVEIKNESGDVTKVYIPEDADFEVKDRVIIVTPRKVVRTWKDLNKTGDKKGFYIEEDSEIREVEFVQAGESNKNIFISEKHAKSALAMAQISQLMPYFGGEITDEEWENANMKKYVIDKYKGDIDKDTFTDTYFFLAFHTAQQRDDFLKYNKQLVRDYLMID